MFAGHPASNVGNLAGTWSLAIWLAIDIEKEEETLKNTQIDVNNSGTGLVDGLPSRSLANFEV